MEHHNSSIDTNLEMGVLSFAISFLGFIMTEAMTGEVIHLFSIVVGAVVVFLVQKLCKYLWEKYVDKVK